ALNLKADGTFTYTPSANWTPDSFKYCGNGTAACATVTLAACASGCLEGAGGISVPNSAFTANTSKYLAIKTPGVLTGAVDGAGYPLTVDTTSVVPSSGLSVVPDANGGFAASVSGPGVYTFTFKAKNSQGTLSAAATVTLSCEQGQTMGGNNVVCDVGNGACRVDSTGSGQTAVDPSQVHLDPTKRYYISVLPGDAAVPFNAGFAGAPDCAGAAGGVCGHGMGGAPIAKGQTAVTVLTVPSPYPPAKLTVFVF